MKWYLIAGLIAASATAADEVAIPAKQPLPHKLGVNIEKSGFSEPSDIVFHTKRGTLFMVGDGGDVAEMKTDGTIVKARRVRHEDFEGITFNPATGLVYIGVEGQEKILELDPDRLEVMREFTIPRTYKGATVMKEGGQGIEALAFLPDPKHPHGGTFLVANQCFNLALTEDGSAIFELNVPLRDKNATTAEIVRMIPMPITDLSAICVDHKTGKLLVVSDNTDTLLEMTVAGKVERAWTLPGRDQEGLAIDPNDNLYIAQDCGGVIQLKWERK
jgi:uncharacterized protein YjiK